MTLECQKLVYIGVCDPCIFAMENDWIGVQGKMVDEWGVPVTCESDNVFRWKTRDLIRFEEVGPLNDDVSASHAAHHIQQR